MLKKLIIDSSTLIALERAKLLNFLNKINYELIIPNAVYEEVKIKLRNIRIEIIKGRTLKFSKKLEALGFGKGEAECLSLAKKLNLRFIVCDDAKALRKLFFLRDDDIRNLRILGFSFFLHLFYKKGLIEDVWLYFNNIINSCKWERSEVQISNYTFLKEFGY